MRPKQLRLIITFETTTQAMAAEAFCKSRNIPGRLIPLPREISAGCGLSWSAPAEAREQIENLFAACSVPHGRICRLLI